MLLTHQKNCLYVCSSLLALLLSLCATMSVQAQDSNADPAPSAPQSEQLALPDANYARSDAPATDEVEPNAEDAASDTPAIDEIELGGEDATSNDSVIGEAETDAGETEPKRTVVTFEFEEVQISDGSTLTITRLTVTEPVTVSLFRDDGGVRDTTPIVSFSDLDEPKEYTDLPIVIPDSERPTVDTSYYLAVFRKSDGSAQGSSRKVKLMLAPVVRVLKYDEVQSGDTAIVLNQLSIARPVTIAASTDISAGLVISPVIEVQASAGSHENLSLEFPKDQQPVVDQVYWLQIFDTHVFDTDEYTASSTISVTVDLATVLLFAAKPVQHRDGVEVVLQELRNSEPVTVSVSFDEDGEPGEDLLYSGLFAPGRHKEKPLLLATKIETDTVLWLALSGSGGAELPEPLRIDYRLRPPQGPEDLETVDILLAPEQIGDGSQITITKVDTSVPVTLALREEIDSTPINTLTLPADLHEGVAFQIPADRKPVMDTVYWVTASSEMSLTLSAPISTTLLVLPPPLVKMWRVEPVQEGDGSAVAIAVLDITQGMTVSLYHDEDSSPAEVSLVSRFFPAGAYENALIEMPAATRSITDTLYWLQLFTQDQVAASEPISTQLLIRPESTVLPRIEVSNQKTDGYNAIFELVRVAKDSWLLVYEQNADQEPRLAGYSRIRPGEHHNVLVLFDNEVQRGTQMTAVLHEDSGVIGKMEFPDGDRPIMQFGDVVAKSFILGLPAVEAENQTSEGDIVTIDRVISPKDGWVVLYDSLSGDVMGIAAVPAGLSLAVDVVLTPGLAGGTHTIWAVLHTDRGESGAFEFPTPDIALENNEQLVVDVFLVTVDPASAASSLIRISGEVLIQGGISLYKVKMPVPGWVVVYRDSDGNLGEKLGGVKLGPGVFRDIHVPLSSNIADGDLLWVSLHKDAGDMNVLEIPKPDRELLQDGMPVRMMVTAHAPAPTGMPQSGNSLSGFSSTNALGLTLLFLGIPSIAFVRQRIAHATANIQGALQKADVIEDHV